MPRNPGSPSRSASRSASINQGTNQTNDAANTGNTKFSWYWAVVAIVIIFGVSITSASQVRSAVTNDQIPMHDTLMEIPTVDELRASMRRQGCVGNNTVFWHGDVPDKLDLLYARSLEPKGHTLEYCLHPEDQYFSWHVFQRQPWDHPYWKNVAWALAHESKGSVWVLMSGQRARHVEPISDSLFFNYAFGVLRKNPKIERIMGVICKLPDGEKWDCVDRVIWEQGDELIYHMTDADFEFGRTLRALQEGDFEMLSRAEWL